MTWPWLVFQAAMAVATLVLAAGYMRLQRYGFAVALMGLAMVMIAAVVARTV